MDGGAWWAAVHGVVTKRLHFHFSLSCIGEGNGNPLQCSCLENPRDGGAWWAAVMGSHRVGHDWSNLAAAAAVVVLVASAHSYYFHCILGLMPCINGIILQAFRWVRPCFYSPLPPLAARRSWSFPFLRELIKEADIQGQIQDVIKIYFH